jgi:adenylate cyclase
MHGGQYHIEKSSIMEPIKTFIHLVDKRTEKKLTELNKKAQRLVVLIVISGICLIITLTLMIWILNKRILNRANKLLNTSIKILDGDLNARSNIKGSDELGSVGKTFDIMIEKLSNAIMDAQEKTKNESERNKQLQIEQTRSEDLLNNILPKKISSRLKNGETTIAETYPEVSVLFTDLVGFTELSEQVGPRELVGMLNRIFGMFDRLAKEMKLEKIKTIGDAYMIVGGIPERDPLHCQRIAEFAIEGLRQFKEFTKTFDHPLEIRIGIHTGTVVAGVVGIHKFTFDLWGDVVNIASRIESHAKPNTIQVSNAVKVRLVDDFDFVDNGELDVKGKGSMKAWDLIKRKPNTEQLYKPNKNTERFEGGDMKASIDTLTKNYSPTDTINENEDSIDVTN